MTLRNHPANTHRNLHAALQGVDPVEAERLEEVWNLLDAAPQSLVPRPAVIDAARRRVLAATGLGESDAAVAASAHSSEKFAAPPLQPDRRPRRRPSRRRRAIAAALVVGAALAAVAYGWVVPRFITAPPGRHLTQVLPDGSRAELNSGAAIRYRRLFGWMGFDRTIRLEGEAFFEVVPDGEPFVVRTFNSRVQVVGTRFNVRAWRDLEQSTIVSVEEGRVTVVPETFTRPGVTVSAGQSVRVGAEHSEIDSLSFSVADATAWRAGELVYRDRMLGVVVADVNRRFSRKIILGAGVPETTRVHVVWRRPSDTEEVAHDLAFALGLKYRERSNGFELYDPSER